MQGECGLLHGLPKPYPPCLQMIAAHTSNDYAMLLTEALLRAVRFQHLDLVDSLLAMGADALQPGAAGYSALSCAALQLCPGSIKRLVESIPGAFSGWLCVQSKKVASVKPLGTRWRRCWCVVAPLQAGGLRVFFFAPRQGHTTLFLWAFLEAQRPDACTAELELPDDPGAHKTGILVRLA